MVPKRPRPDTPSSTTWVQKKSNIMTDQEMSRKMTKFLDSSDWSWIPKPNGQFLLQGTLCDRELSVSWYPATGKVLFQGKENDVTFFKNRWKETSDNIFGNIFS